VLAGQAEPAARAVIALAGSARARLVVAAAFAAMFTTVGVAFSFGSLVGPLSRDLGVGQGAAAGVFSLTSACFFGLGAISGHVVDRLGPRPVLLAGAASFGLGLGATAAAPRLWIVYLGHGLGGGLAAACTFVPLVAVVTGWFRAGRTMAVGIAVSGIGVGTLVIAPAAAAAIHAYGWRTTYAWIAGLGTLVLLLCALLVARPPKAPSHLVVPLRDSLTTGDYSRLYLGQLLLAAAMFVPFVYLPSSAEALGVHPVAAAGLVGVIGAVSLGGRLALAPVADRVGLVPAYRACFLAIGASFLLWAAADGYEVLFAFAVVFGLGYGGFVSLGPGVLAQRFGTARLGGLLGTLYTSSAIGSSVGPFTAGLLINHGGYRAGIVMALVLGLAATVVVSGVSDRQYAAAPTAPGGSVEV
jgi:MFS family permease